MNYAGRHPVPFESQEERHLWLNDPRYKGHEQNPAYQLHCLARLMMTPDEILITDVADRQETVSPS